MLLLGKVGFCFLIGMVERIVENILFIDGIGFISADYYSINANTLLKLILKFKKPLVVF